jgi:Holliday junction resolvasome RuvABC endonuclease subunit
VGKRIVTRIGLDPGTRNFGVYVGRWRVNKDKLEYISSSKFMLDTTVDALVDATIEQQSRDFIESVETRLLSYKPDVITIERYMARGLKSVTGEAVSVMIGLLLGICQQRDIKVHLTNAATWKNKVNRQLKPEDYSLNQLYTDLKDIENHLVDAFFLSICTHETFPHGFSLTTIREALNTNVHHSKKPVSRKSNAKPTKLRKSR